MLKHLNHKPIKVSILPLGTLKIYKFTAVFARYNNKWLYCRHKDRMVFETPGGHVEPGESPLEAAKRELFEESGVVKFDIEPLFDYRVESSEGRSHGQVFYSLVHELGHLPNFEMAEIVLLDGIPRETRFPQILPVLFEHLCKIKHING